MTDPLPHICHLTTVHAAGDNRIFHKECMSLARAGYRVTLIAGKGSEQEHPVRVRIIRIPAFRALRMSIGVWRIIRQAFREKADVYHIHDFELVPAGLLLRLRGSKVIADVHENLPAALLSKPYLPPVAGNILSWLSRISEHLLYPLCSAIITARPDISKRFPSLSPVTVRNYPILPDFTNLEPVSVPGGPPGIIFVGGLSAIRGIRELIRAFNGLWEARLWLLGPFESEEFRKECESLPGWENTQYFGVVRPHEVYSYLRLAKAGIITFLPYPNHVTTLATKPFEYMAAGLPLIMSDFAYWRETFGENAVYTDPADPSAIRAAVRNLLGSPGLAEPMGRRNSELARTVYCWRNEQVILTGLYKRLLS